MEREMESEEPVLEENDDEQEETKPETPEESAKLALEEIVNENAGSEDGEEKENEVSGPESEHPQQDAVAPQDAAPVEEDFTPPARLSDSEKSLFNRLPKKLKPAVARMFKEHQAHFTRTQQEAAKHMRAYQQAEQNSRHVLEAVRPYYVSHPELAERGITEGGLVTMLIAAHQKLSNPQTARKEYIELGKSLGFDVGALEGGEQGGVKEFEIEKHPKFIALQNQVHQSLSRQQQWYTEQQAAPIAAELTAIQREIDPRTNNYAYPELQDQWFINSVKPLVSAAVRNNPGLSYGDALKQVILEKRQQYGFSNGSNQARLPVNGNQQPNRAVSAAVSVRGRSPTNGRASVSDADIPRGETPEQSAWAALEDIRRGLN